MKFWLYLTSAICLLIGLVAGDLVAAHISPLGLNALAKIGEIITALSALIAVATFVYQVRKDAVDAAIEQLNFIGEKFIPRSRELFGKVRSVSKIPKDANLPTIRMDSVSLVWIRESEDRKKVADTQTKPFEDNPDLNTEALDLINMLEIFSQQLVHKGIIKHPALAAARPTFVQFIEATAAVICTMTYLSDDSYQGIKKVYVAWRDLVDRDDLHAKIEKTKVLITKKERVAADQQLRKG